MAKEKIIVENEQSVEEKLVALSKLQNTLSEIDKIKTLRGELPLEVQDLEDEIAVLLISFWSGCIWLQKQYRLCVSMLVLLKQR